MEFPLPDADFPAFAFPVLGFQFVDIGFEFVEVVEAVVGDADGADAARLLGFEEGEPGAAAGFFAAVGGVDEISLNFLGVRETRVFAICFFMTDIE